MPFLVTLCVAAAPLTALVVLALLGLVGLLPAAAAIAFTILGSAVFSLVSRRWECSPASTPAASC